MLARMPTLPVKRVAWLLPRALVHAGEAGFERIDAGGQPLKGGQQFPVVGVQLLQDSQVSGIDALPGREHLGIEVCPAHRLGLAGWFGAQEPFREEERRADCPGDGRPALTRDSASGSNWGVEVCVHGDWILVACYWLLITGYRWCGMQDYPTL